MKCLYYAFVAIGEKPENTHIILRQGAGVVEEYSIKYPYWKESMEFSFIIIGEHSEFIDIDEALALSIIKNSNKNIQMKIRFNGKSMLNKGGSNMPLTIVRQDITKNES